MTDFQSEFDQLTDTIDTTISTQLSSVHSWTNIPGSLHKISSSLAGYVWGFTGSNLYKCQIPCSGNWQPVSISTSAITDLTTDESNVFVLTSDSVVHIGNANGQGPFTTIKCPIYATSIFSTHTYIWVQDSKGQKKKCPKPCTMANWLDVKDNGTLITSSNDTSLFGKDGSGKSYQSDEHLQSGWSEMTQLAKTQILHADDSGIYGIDTNQHLLFCEGSKCNPTDTSGLTPASLSKTSGDLWMTTVESGEKGNVFWKTEKPDYTSIMNTLTPLDAKRHEVAKQIHQEQLQQDMVSTIQSKADTIVTFMTKLFSDLGKDKDTSEKTIHKLQTEIYKTQAYFDTINAVRPILEKLFFTVVAVTLVYLVGGFIGPAVHVVALGVLAIGFYLSIT